MEFVPPPPGSYKLQKIQRVSDAALLDSTGRTVRLASLTQDKITLLTFFYTYCVDPLGCPFAHVTLADLRDRVRDDRSLAGRVRFVSISLDPTHDSARSHSGLRPGIRHRSKFRVAFLDGAPRAGTAARSR